MPQGSQVSWINDSEDYQISFVPGVDRCEETKYSKNKDNPAFIKKKKSSSPYMLPKNTENDKSPERSKSRKPISLKDLCAEDKKRVAHLIQELANLQDEKDEIDERFELERKEFQQQLRDLQNDKQEILREKDSINSKYEKCQAMLQEYQQNITQQQRVAAEEIKLLNESVKAHYTNSSRHVHSRQSLSPTMKMKLPEEDEDDELPYEASPRVTPPVTKKRPMSASAELRARTMEKLDESLARLGIQHNSLFKDCDSSDAADVCDGSLLQSRRNRSFGRKSPNINGSYEHQRSVRNCSGRRRQLAAQKAALEREQNQLRQLLQEQEDLLDKRQKDLQLYQTSQVNAAGDMFRPRSSSSNYRHQQAVTRRTIEFDGNQSYPRSYHQQQQVATNNNMSKSLNHQPLPTNYLLGSPRIQSTMLAVDPLADIHVRSYSDFVREEVDARSYQNTDKVKISNSNLRHAITHDDGDDVIQPMVVNNSINYQNSLNQGESMTSAKKKLNDVTTPACQLPHAYYNKSIIQSPSSSAPRHHHVISDDVTTISCRSDITDIVDAIEDEEERQPVFSPIMPTRSSANRFVVSQVSEDDSELLEDIFFIK